jgi:hypothetical protein
MPSTYSTSLKLQLIGTGEQAGTWGTTTNTNLGTLLEQAITGVITIPMGDATYTLTNYNGLSDEARNAVLMLNGPITAPQYLVAPPGQQKVYIVRNRTGNTVTLTTGTGSNISIANAGSEVVYCDGANFYSATQFNYINGDLTVTGNATIGKSITFGNNLYGNASTDQVYLPVGTTAERAATGQNGLIRYNTTSQFYEGYANGTWIRFIVAPQGVYSISYLIVAGGGGGADVTGTLGTGQGGGGGGGYVANTLTATSGTVYTLVIGAGGGAQATGSNSYISGISTAYGGGAGNAGAGGSGGGGGGDGAAGGAVVSPGQGNVGGNGSSFWGSGGGGGGGGAPGSGGAYVGGSGGAGVTNTLTGTTVTYAGGGGGIGQYPDQIPGSGGSGGGGANGGNGVANSGGGGGGYRGAGGSGGKGIIILSIPTVSYSGIYTGLPTITTVGSNTVLQYTQSGTYTSI